MTYKLTTRVLYKWVEVEEVYLVEATSKEAAEALYYDGDAKLTSSVIISTQNEKEDYIINTEVVTPKIEGLL